jgi:hypothetical protein
LKAKYGKIQLYAPYCYDAMMVLAEAMQRANSAEPAKYLPEMAKTNYSGVTANIKFDDKGDLQGGAITVYRVVKGEWQVLKTVRLNKLRSAPLVNLRFVSVSFTPSEPLPNFGGSMANKKEKNHETII